MKRSREWKEENAESKRYQGMENNEILRHTAILSYAKGKKKTLMVCKE